MVDSGLVGIKNNPWELGEGKWGVEEWKGRREEETLKKE